MPYFHLEDPENSPEMALNAVALHPRATAAAAQLLCVEPDELRLSQDFLRARYGHMEGGEEGEEAKESTSLITSRDGEQHIHVDYGNNSLAVPARVPAPDAVALILYHSDVEDAGGPTHFARSLPGELTTYDAEKAPFNPPNLLGQAGRDPAMLERLYADQRPIRFTVGTVALYRLDAWHRGEPPPFGPHANAAAVAAAALKIWLGVSGTAPAVGKHRVIQHLNYRRADAEWIQWQSFPRPMSSMPTRFIGGLSPTQRVLLGFPKPGHPYWNSHTAEAVGRRYPEMGAKAVREASGLARM